MKKRIKILLITASSLILLAIAVFFAARHGWRLFGFRFCDGVVIENVSIDGDTVRITGSSPGIFPAPVVGYTARESDGRLYVGFKRNSFFGVWIHDKGAFDVTLDVSDGTDSIYLITRHSETLIWNEELGNAAREVDTENSAVILIKLGDIQNIRDIGLNYSAGGVSGTTGMQNANGTALEPGDVMYAPFYSFDFPPAADLSDFSFTVQLTDCDGRVTYASGRIICPLEYGEVYQFSLSYTGGTYKISEKKTP